MQFFFLNDFISLIKRINIWKTSENLPKGNNSKLFLSFLLKKNFVIVFVSLAKTTLKDFQAPAWIYYSVKAFSVALNICSLRIWTRLFLFGLWQKCKTTSYESLYKVSYHKRQIPPAQIIQVSELLKNSKVLGEDSLETQVFKGNSQEFEK